MESLILPVIIMIAILLIVAFLIPKLIKLAIALIAIYLLFHIGYIWTAEETAQNLHLDAWMKEEDEKKFVTFYKDFYADREEKGGVVDVGKVKSMMDTTIQAAKEDLSVVTDEEKEQMKKYWSLIFETLNSEEAKRLIEETKDTWKQVFTEKEMNELAIKSIEK